MAVLGAQLDTGSASAPRLRGRGPVRRDEEGRCGWTKADGTCRPVVSEGSGQLPVFLGHRGGPLR